MLPDIEYLVGRNVRKSTAISSADIWRNAVKAKRGKWLGIEEGRFGLLLDLG